MSKMKSLTQRILELKEKYLQPVNVMPKIKQTIVTTIALATILKYIVIPVAASEPINVKDYIKQNNYNLSTIFQLYLNPLDENGLDENEKRAIDIIANTVANAPEEKQDELKSITKEIYNNGQLTPEILTKLENLNIPSGKPTTIEDKISGKESKGLTYKQESFIDRLKDRKINLASVEDDVKLALGIIGKYPDWFDEYSSISGGQYKAEALLNLVNIAREIEPEIGMSAESFLDKYCELISTASNRMLVFYNAICGSKTGPLVDEKLDEKEYNLVKDHILYLVKKNEDKKLALNIAEPNKMNPLPITDFKEMELWKSLTMEKMALNSIVLPYQLFMLEIKSNGKIGSLDKEATNKYFISDSSKQLENAINNQKLIEKYYNKLEDILTNKNTLNNYLKEATTWSTEAYKGFKNNGVYTPDGTAGEKNSSNSVPYQFAKFLSKSDDWSKLNLAAVNMIMSKFKKSVVGDCTETTSTIQYMMCVLGLPSYDLIVGNLKREFYTKTPKHEDIMISIPDITLENAEKKFGKLMKYENAISPFYPSKTQINKVLDPIIVVNICLPGDFYREVIKYSYLRR